ncbi:MAG: hypothetical protein IJG36_05905 [Synergistaceae bacterium]|nr:hypothetical protein [Synergistaceae bacterium]MBQ3758821.1 hypothetical protein [Synergistaceae bacterium]
MKTTINGFDVIQDFNVLIGEVRKLGCGGYYIPRVNAHEYIFVTKDIPSPIWHVFPTVCDSESWQPKSDSDREILGRLETLKESRAYRRMWNLLVVRFTDAYRAYDWLALAEHEFQVTSRMGFKWSHEVILRECERKR